MRTVPKQDHGGIVQALEALANEVARDFHPDLRVEVEVQEDVGPLETDRAEPLVDAMISSVQRVRGEDPTVGGVTYGTDAAYLGPGFNIPMVICGPGAQGMAHQPDEYVEVEQLVQAAAIYADLAQRLLG
jgi:succinyl-diaminopimelate desuccinylase